MNRATGPQDRLRAQLAVRPVLLDGGLATQLSAQGNDLSDDLWSARLLADDPEQIREAHRRYFRAGAQVAISASYQASVSGFARRGLGTAEAERLLRRSVTVAQQARADLADEASGNASANASGETVDDHDRSASRWVAASIGPYGATLADGSEYRGRYGLSHRQLVQFHRSRLHILAEAEPDVFAVETIPDCDEAAAILDILAELSLPAWLSFTIADGKTAAGQPLSDAFAMAEQSPSVIAVGVNCSAPGEVGPALATARSVSAKPVLAYPNSGERWNALTRTWTGTAGLSPELTAEWISSGIGLIGGCCRTAPDDIARLAGQLADADQAQYEDAPLQDTGRAQEAEADAPNRAESQPR